MLSEKILQSFEALRRYCEAEGFKGWDPYDGLNSRIFRAIPLAKRSALCRLAVIQGFKRFPFNLRRLALVPKQYNAKGIGLFLQGYCNMYRLVGKRPELASRLGGSESIAARVAELADLLLALRCDGYSGACWGYNFDWQARRLFPVSEEYPHGGGYYVLRHGADRGIRGNPPPGVSRCSPLVGRVRQVHDLHRSPSGRGFLFSYSPLPGNDTVFNASLLGSKLLALCYKHTGRSEYLDAARKSVEACCDAQRSDGSWPYGMLPVQSWIDSFHTGYNLEALACYRDNTGDESFDGELERGLTFYLGHFFEQDGTPKYYHDKTYPIDIHCPGQLPVTLARIGRLGEHADLAERVLCWAIDNMQSRKGYFYYQLKPGISSPDIIYAVEQCLHVQRSVVLHARRRVIRRLRIVSGGAITSGRILRSGGAHDIK